MKKIIVLLSLFALASCSLASTKNNEVNTETGTKVDEVSISSGVVNTGDIIVVTKSGTKVDDISVSSGENEEKDIVVISDNKDTTKDELEGKTQEEVVDEMGDYVNDLFNMIDEDVK